MVMKEKLCSECNEIKNESEFKICYIRNGRPCRVKFCKDCMRERYRDTKRKWNASNPEKVLGQQRRARAKNGSILRQRVKEYYMKNPERIAASLEKSRFSRAIYRSRRKAEERGHMPCAATADCIRASFTGRCFVCGASEEEHGKRLCMDHNHLTGKFRGWLCENCNLAAGKLKDSSSIARNLSVYLNQ